MTKYGFGRADKAFWVCKLDVYGAIVGESLLGWRFGGVREP